MTPGAPARSAFSPVWPGLIEAYRPRLPVSRTTPVVTLHEGDTPLLPAPELSQRTGMAPVPLVTAAAASRRRRAREAQAVAAQRLGVLVVLPTGLCLLPAFVLLTVAPLVLDLLS